MTDELIPIEPITEVASEPFEATAELQAAVAAALSTIGARSYSERHPELGKMIKCQVCGRRHRESEKHEQVFTYRAGDYELFREDEKGELVPDYRTAMRPDEKPTIKQVVGAAAFAKKRFHPHLSKMKLLFVQRTREVFTALGFSLDEKGEEFEKNLQRARVVAARQIRKEHRAARKVVLHRQDVSRRINRGFLRGSTR